VEGDTAEKANLRDKTWSRQHAYITEMKKRMEIVAKFPWPDGGIYWPLDLDRAGKTAEKATPRTDADDEVLWFAPVAEDSATEFQHLVGNVAEYVCDDPEACDEQLQELDTLSATALQEMVKKNPKKLSVIGGSALSPPQMEIEKAYPVNVYDQKGYADVGFRLAFTTPYLSLTERVKNLLYEPRYVPDE
jgi:hypothetical protein